MNSEFNAYFVAIASLLIITLIIIVGLIRWILRINVIVNLLEENNQLLRNIAKIKCDACGKNYPAEKMVTIDSGQNLCSECFKTFKN
jgi:hypothetical protein